MNRLTRDALICLLHNHRCTDPENCSGPDKSDEKAADRAISLMRRAAARPNLLERGLSASDVFGRGEAP
jgi:hypothetical protein